MLKPSTSDIRNASDSVSAASLRVNTLWMLAGRLVRTGVQAAYFVLLARSLGVSHYGAFVAAAGLAGAFAPFASLGSGNLLIKHVTVNPLRFPLLWGEALSMCVVSGTILCGVGASVGHFILPPSVPLGIIVPILVAELIFARVIEVAGQAYQAFEKLRQMATLLLGLSVCRMLAAAALLLAHGHPTPTMWGNLYLISTAVPALVAIFAVSRHLGRPQLHINLQRASLIEGFYFAISLAAATIYNDIDKTMLAKLSGIASAGLYGAAYRIIDVAGTPLGALLAASYSRFFKLGSQGLSFSAGFARQLMPKAILFGTVCSLSLILCAPAMLPLLGRQYANSVSALRWLSPIVLFRCIHYLGADALSGAGRQGLRSLLQIFVAVVNIGLNIAFLPRYSWRGAAIISVASDALLAVLIWGAIWYVCRRPGATPSARLPDAPISDIFESEGERLTA